MSVAPAATASPRLTYLDVLRGVAVLIMVLAHVADAWTREADRHDFAYYTTLFIGGLGAPLFLLLAGVAQVMSANVRARRAGALAAGRAAMWRRGWDVFILAWLFRVQSQVLGWGSLSNLLRVDILNVMGLAMVAAALLWGWSASRARRIAVLAAATVAATAVTPLIRALPWLAALPDPVEAYLRPAGGYAAFSLFPWMGFLFAGGIIGELVDSLRLAEGEADAPPSARSGHALRAHSRRVPSMQSRQVTLQASIAVVSVAGALAAWWASYRPSIFPGSQFWTSSPAFFVIRLGIVTALLPATWAHCRFWLTERESVSEPERGHRSVVSELEGGLVSAFGRVERAVTRACEVMGRSSLFVYWIHVEMVYGFVANPLKRALPLPAAIAATLALAVLLFLITRLKNRWMDGVVLPPRARVLASVLR